MPIAADRTTQGKARYRTCGLAAAFAAALAFSTAAAPAAAQQAPPADYSQQQLEAFAAASHKIEELNREWIPQISQAESAEENAEMRERAMDEMEAAVQQEGLTVEQYNQIYDTAQRDPEVMQTIEEHRDSLR